MGTRGPGSTPASRQASGREHTGVHLLREEMQGLVQETALITDEPTLQSVHCVLDAAGVPATPHIHRVHSRCRDRLQVSYSQVVNVSYLI